MYSYLDYWGKAKRDPQAEGPDYHLLPYHCLDVAAVGIEYLKQHDSLSRFFCEQLSCSKEDWLAWAGFWPAPTPEGVPHACGDEPRTVRTIAGRSARSPRMWG